MGADPPCSQKSLYKLQLVLCIWNCDSSVSVVPNSWIQQPQITWYCSIYCWEKSAISGPVQFKHTLFKVNSIRICSCIYTILYIIYIIGWCKQRKCGTSNYWKRRGANQPPWCVHFCCYGICRTHRQPLPHCRDEYVPISDLWHSAEDTVFQGRDLIDLAEPRAGPSAGGSLGTLRDSSILTKGKVEILLPEEGEMHAGMSGETDDQ